MGQKVNPIAFRTGIMIGWRSRWYAPKKEFADLLVEDYKIRQYIKHWRPKSELADRRGREDRPVYSAIANIEIERTRDEVKVIVHTARPGLLIGRKGERIEELQNELQMLTGRRVNIDVQEITKPEIVAQLVAEDIAEQLTKRASFRRAMKRAMDMAMQAGAKGIKVQLSGRLGGAEMSRREKAIMGSIPLSTLRAKIDYGFAIAKIPQGVIGVQVWINQGMYEEPSDGADAQTGQTSKKPKRTYKR
jgi:small subunit ribosomal protein S3